MRSSKAISDAVRTVKQEAGKMVTQARAQLHEWLVAGDGTSSTREALFRQADGAREAYAAALADVETAEQRFDSAADEDAAEKAADELARAKANAARAAAYCDRAERAIERHAAAEAAARRTELEQRKAELEASLSNAAIDASTEPSEHEELQGFLLVFRARVARAEKTSAIAERFAQLIVIYDQLGMDSTSVVGRLSTLRSIPQHSHLVLVELEKLASRFEHDDPRHQIAAALASSTLPQRMQAAAE